MPRDIIIETPDSTEHQVHVDSTPVEESSVSFASLSTDELNQLFQEWDSSGKNDLIVEPDMVNRVRAYLAHQKELDTLRTELAERIYKPFVVTDYKVHDGETFGIIDNRADLTIASGVFFHSYGGRNCIINLSDFKTIALALGISQASYIPESHTIGVNLFAYLNSISRSYKINVYTINLL